MSNSRDGRALAREIANYIKCHMTEVGPTEMQYFS